MRAHVNTALEISATKLPLLHEMEERAGERKHVWVESGVMVTLSPALSRSFVAGEGETLGCRALKAREMHALNSRFPIHGPLVFNISRA
jgi:hypothetical protein